MGFLRLFLALSVVVKHMPNRHGSLLDAGVAVLCFFMLSGFYMALTIHEVYAHQGSGWQRDFYLSRALRLYPAYLVMLTVMAVCFGLTNTPNVFLDHPAVPLPAFLALAALNVFIFGQDLFQLMVNSIRFDALNPVSRAILQAMPREFFENAWMLIGQAWSLGSECLFYAMAPFIVRSVRRILCCLGISLAIRFGLIFCCHGFASKIWGYNFFPATCCLFLMGSLAYHAYPKLRGKRLPALAGVAISVAFAAFAAVSMVLWHGILPAAASTGYDTPQLWAAYILFACSLPLLFCYWRTNRIDRWAGELSYPIYLVHGLIIGLVFTRIAAGQAWDESAALVLSLAAAALIVVLIDRPMDAWRHRRFAAHSGAPPAPRRRGEWVVLPVACALLFANTLRLYAFARPVAAPPILLVVCGTTNIVHYDGRVFGVPQGDPITWGAPNYDRDPRLIIAASLSAVQRQLLIAGSK